MERDKLLSTMDAKVWTDEFMATRARLGDKEFDHAMMLAWFANAIMAGFDEANRRAQRDLDAEREKVKRLSTCGTDHSTPWWQVKCEDLEAQLATLRQLVEALPVVDGRMDVECGACYYIRSFVAEQYGVVCGLITEQSTAMAIKALLEYRATLAAQDAGKEPSHD